MFISLPYQSGNHYKNFKNTYIYYIDIYNYQPE